MSVELEETALKDIPEIVDNIRKGYNRRLTWSEFQQKQHAHSQLKALKKLLEQNKSLIVDALKADLNKSEVEAISSEYNIVLAELIETIREFHVWTQPRFVSKGVANMMDDCYVKPEPLGVALILGAWNYPFQLVALPFVGAIAAGNAVILKPSELSVHTSNLFCRLIPQYMDTEHFAVVGGGIDVSQCLLKERFDHIFYTGSTPVGKIIMKAAAEHLTPVVLELGGKSPVIVADDANIDIAARRIMWGKLLNCGQTCIAPDYVLCSPNVRDELVDRCKRHIEEFFGKEPSQSPDYVRIINKRHFKRITDIMKNTSAHNVLDSNTIEEQKYISPAIYVDVTEDDPLMKDEIFGPLLPVVTVTGVDEAIQFINGREKPLAFYVFTESKKTFDFISSHTSSGAIVQNTVMIQHTLNTLPFGGIGHSGMGAYHGKYTFDVYSHMKPVLRTGTKMDFLLKVIYPPHNLSKLKQFNFLQLPSSRRWNLRPYLMLFLLLAVAIIAVKVHYGSWPVSFLRRFFS